MVVGCLFILDCPLIFDFSLKPNFPAKPLFISLFSPEAGASFYPEQRKRVKTLLKFLAL